MNRTQWIETMVPEQRGRTVIITGANSGIGLETARVFAEKGASVILACRSVERGEVAAGNIRESVAGATTIEVEALDLASLLSVRNFAGRIRKRLERLDLLINNAGVMVPPLTRTEDGFELQMGVNHLGHYAVTGELLPLLVKTPGARVVTVTSMAHRMGRMDFSDVNWEHRPYHAWKAYGQSKLANLLFAFECQRRFSAAGWDLASVAAHPGWTATDLMRHSGAMAFAARWIAMPCWQGALPTIRAATVAQPAGGRYFGPSGPMEIRGYPREVQAAPHALVEASAAELWALSAELTGNPFSDNSDSDVI